jgi:uncharacterized protein (TIGR02246 family)
LEWNITQGGATMSAAEIADANRVYQDAVRRGDAGAIADLYTADALLLPRDGPTIKGREAIRQWLSSGFARGWKSLQVESIALEIEIEGDTASEVAYVTLGSAEPGGHTTTVVVKSLVVWKKSAGQWQLHRDMWNAATA